MTMHLMSPQFSTTNTRKRKTKITQAQQDQRVADWHVHNRWLRQRGQARIDFETYCDEISGKKYKPQAEFRELQSSNVYRRGAAAAHIPSASDEHVSPASAAKPDTKVYSGERQLLGIATMHKSNMVPVFDTESATDIARMRRN